jgi:hypothetical protein
MVIAIGICVIGFLRRPDFFMWTGNAFLLCILLPMGYGVLGVIAKFTRCEPRRRRLLNAGYWIVTVLLFASWSWVRSSPRAVLERFLHDDVPPSVRNIECKGGAGPAGIHYLFRFEVDPVDLQRLVQNRTPFEVTNSHYLRLPPRLADPSLSQEQVFNQNLSNNCTLFGMSFQPLHNPRVHRLDTYYRAGSRRDTNYGSGSLLIDSSERKAYLHIAY